MKRWLWIGLAAAALAVIALLLLRPRRVAVSVAEVTRGDVRGDVAASGEILPRGRVDVAPQVIGRVEKLDVREGDVVRKGDRLAELDPSTYTERRDRAEEALVAADADVQHAAAALETARLKSERARQLAARKIASGEFLASAEHERAAAEAALAGARERKRAAQAALDAAKDDLAKTTVTAPTGGRVTRVLTEEGETVAPATAAVPGRAILSISDPSVVEAAVRVDAGAAARIHTGQSAAVRGGNARWRGEVEEVGGPGPAVPGAAINVRIRLADAPASLRPGIPVQASVAADGRANVVLVPVGAILENGARGSDKRPVSAKQDGVKIVYRIEGDRARACPVRIGLTDDAHAEIVSGLKGGERIAVGPRRALERLRDGIAVVETGKPKG